jgi:hypothetical protein
MFVFHSSIASGDNFPPCGIYDDGCHLVKFVRNHYGNDLAETTASKILYETRFSVDRTHFKGHVGRWCRSNMNPDKNPSKMLPAFVFSLCPFSLTSAQRCEYPSCGAVVCLA